MSDPREDDAMTTMAVKLTPELKKRLAAAAERRCIGQGLLARRAIENLLDQLEKRIPTTRLRRRTVMGCENPYTGCPHGCIYTAFCRSCKKEHEAEKAKAAEKEDRD